MSNVAQVITFTAGSDITMCSIPVQNFIFIIHLIHFCGNSGAIKISFSVSYEKRLPNKLIMQKVIQGTVYC